MQAPSLTQEWFDECKARGLTSINKIGKLNSTHCKKNFSFTIPKALLTETEAGYNAYLIIKNQRERFKYLGLIVNDIAGRLHITRRPDFIWTGYLKYGNTWYAVTADMIIAGRIPASAKVIRPEIEYLPEATS